MLWQSLLLRWNIMILQVIRCLFANIISKAIPYFHQFHCDGHSLEVLKIPIFLITNLLDYGLDFCWQTVFRTKITHFNEPRFFWFCLLTWHIGTTQRRWWNVKWLAFWSKCQWQQFQWDEMCECWLATVAFNIFPTFQKVWLTKLPNL